MLMIAMLIAAIVGMIQTWQKPPAGRCADGRLSESHVPGRGALHGRYVRHFLRRRQQVWFRNWVMTGDLTRIGGLCHLVLPQLVWLAMCFVLVWKGTAAARYANK